MGDNFYITPEEYERAAANGIKRGTLEWRIRDGGWDKERAITTPSKRQVRRKKWTAIAKQNGIPERNFLNRLYHGWTNERAATEPLLTREARAERLSNQTIAKCVYPKELIDRAERIGVSRNTFNQRVLAGWSLERAASEPLVSHQERGRRGLRSMKAKYGDISKPIFQKRG